MMKIAAVGSDAFILGFRLAGVNNVFPAGYDNIELTIRNAMSGEKFGILIVHEEEVKHVSEAMKELMLRSIKPVIIKIGGEEEELRNKVKAAIGVDLYASG
ncbi:MAG: V-type ATP synthase subunit F [Thermoplasmata archaeon]|nr:V-type ATP synthase subunit F [Thermoplasmata archaeon]